jgi:hypothetical protein
MVQSRAARVSQFAAAGSAARVASSRVPVAELGQRPVRGVDRFHPAEQRGVGPGQLVRDPGPLPGIAGPREGFGQPASGALAAGPGVGRRQLTQYTGPFSQWRRFGERAAQLVTGLGRRAGGQRGPGRLAEPPGHPGVAGRLGMHQVGGDPAGCGAVSVQLAGCGAVHPVTLVAVERGVDRSPHHRVEEARRVRRRQDLHPDERSGQPDG